MFRFATILAATTALTAPAFAESWDMPTPYGDSTFHTQNIRQFAEDVEAATDGELTITVHSAGSLFPGGEIKNAVRSRQVPIGEFFLSSIVNENAAYGMDSLPFLATTYEDAERLWAAQEPVITELLAEQDLIPLFSVPWPAQGLYTNGYIEEVADLNGLRMRAYNAALEEFATLAGAAPVQVEAVDIPQAFATGQVQAMITSPSTGANSSAWDYVDTYTAIDAWLPKNIVVVNARVFNALSPEMQEAVREAAEAAEARGIEMSREETEAQTTVLADNGMLLAAPTNALMQGLDEIGTTMVENWKTSASEPALEILDAYQSE